MYVQDLNEGLTDGAAVRAPRAPRALGAARGFAMRALVASCAEGTIAPRPSHRPPPIAQLAAETPADARCAQDDNEFDFDGQGSSDPVGAGWGMDDLDSMLLKGMQKKRRQCVLGALPLLRAAPHGGCCHRAARCLTALLLLHGHAAGVLRVWSAWS